MSLVLNMVGGGGGGGISDTDAILTVTVPTGSTVTMTKGGVTLTPTMWVQAADPTLDCALFVIPASMLDSQNAWTVTATLGIDTSSDTVTIDSNKQYDLSLDYIHWLYVDGNERISITGGWTSTGYTLPDTYSVAPVTKNADNLTMSGTKAVTFGTENTIDVTGYSVLKTNVKSANVKVTVVFTKSKNSFASSANYMVAGERNNAGIMAVDVSKVQQVNGYVGFYKVSSGTVVIDKIWLE